MKRRIAVPLFCAAALAPVLAEGAGLPGYLNLAQYPLFLSGNVTPNVLVVYDNSESMDGTMAGKVIAGNDPTTRGNIARSWSSSDFNTSGCGICGTWGFTPTDAGFLPSTPPYPRQFWIPRAWGYLNNPTGAARIWETVQTDSTSHYNRMMSLLAPETSASGRGEIKNASVFTPLAGSVKTAGQYFGGSNGNTSPITVS